MLQQTSERQQPANELQVFTPFPLRARGLVEQFDAAIKLYKQYFWVLLGWSAIAVGSSAVPYLGMAAFFLTPLAMGSCVCCVAAAVRGQNVGFGQCWRFTQPRYWPVLGMHIVAGIIGSVAIAIMIGAMVAITIGGIAAFGSSSGTVQIVMGITAFLLFGTIGTIIGTVLISWMGLVPIVVCMEDDKRGRQALGRASEILSGNWLRITTLMALVGLAMVALLMILGSTSALIVGLNNIREMIRGGTGNPLALVAGIVAFGSSYLLLLMLWTPLYYLILTVFYLDVRVRQEALDLEWTAHTTAPQPSTPQNIIAPLAPDSHLQTSAAEQWNSSPTPLAPFSTSTGEVSTPAASPFIDADPRPDDNPVAAQPDGFSNSDSTPPDSPRPQW